MANKKLLSDCKEQAAMHTPPSLPPVPPPNHLHQPSTNAQWSWTTSIWGIILYEIDGWGQPLTERVKTTLRCPLWISMMENRLLKKIYVCSPLPQEKALQPPPSPSVPTPTLTNQTCHCGQIKLTGSIQLPALGQLAHSQYATRQKMFLFHMSKCRLIISYKQWTSKENKLVKAQEKTTKR